MWQIGQIAKKILRRVFVEHYIAIGLYVFICLRPDGP